MDQNTAEPRVVESNGSFVRVQAGYEQAERQEVSPEVRVEHHGSKTVYRVRVDGENVQEPQVSSRGSYQTRQPAKGENPLLNAYGQHGERQGLADLTEESIISAPSIGGEMRLKEAVALGWACKTPTGYEWLGTDGKPATEDGGEEQPKAEDKKPEEKPIEDEASNLTPESKAFLTDVVKKVGEGPVVAVAQEYMTRGTVADVSDLAEKLGMEPAQAQAAVSKAIGEYDAKVQDFAVKLGVPRESWNALVEFAAKNHANEAVAAQETLFYTGSLSGYRPIVKAFLAHTATLKDREAARAQESAPTPTGYDSFNEHDLEAAVTGAGLRTYRGLDGTLMVNAAGAVMSLRDAIDKGIVRVSRS